MLIKSALTAADPPTTEVPFAISALLPIFTPFSMTTSLKEAAFAPLPPQTAPVIFAFAPICTRLLVALAFLTTLSLSAEPAEPPVTEPSIMALAPTRTLLESVVALIEVPPVTLPLTIRPLRICTLLPISTSLLFAV